MNAKKLIKIICPVIIVAGVGLLAYYGIMYHKAEKGFSEQRDSFVSEEERAVSEILPSAVSEGKKESTGDSLEHTTVLTEADRILSKYPSRKIDHAALKEQNPDYDGWIWIPGSAVDYPVYKSKDNEDYVHHDASNEYSFAGCIMIDCRTPATFGELPCRPEPDMRNVVLHGHNMNNGSMFASIKKYMKEPGYLEEHPFIIYYPCTGDPQLFRVYSSYLVTVEDGAELTFNPSEILSRKVYREFLDYTVSKSEIETGYKPSETQPVITLSTCLGDSAKRYRYIVHASRIS